MMGILPRRQFLSGLAAAFAAPAIVKASSLMPVKVMDLTIYVDHDKPGAFRTIQAAMDYIAKRYPLGNEAIDLQIGPGTFHGSIIADLKNNLNVCGTDNRTYVVATLEAYDHSILRVENLNYILALKR
jgi:hypothetical protein